MPSYYNNIFGWFDFDTIYREANDRFNDALFCEVGSFQGRSACYFAEYIKESRKNNKLICVDLWPTREELITKADLGAGQSVEKDHIRDLPKSILEVFCDHMDSAGVRDYIYPVRQDSSKAASIFPDEYFSMVFIDAGHGYDMVMKDLVAWYPKVKKGGIFAGHDYHSPEVSKAVRDFFGYQVEDRGGSFYMVKE